MYIETMVAKDMGQLLSWQQGIFLQCQLLFIAATN